jgi:hypothetical protein
MNLLQVRQQFRTISGRYDLVDSAGADNGANYYINAGQRFLDRLDETQKSWAIAFRPFAIGQYITFFPYCRAIKEVWFATTTARTQLEKRSLQDMMTEYFTKPGSELDSGTPLYYSPTITRISPKVESPADQFDIFAGYVDIMATNASEYNAIIIAPPPNEASIVQIHGLFYTPELVSDEDETYWTANHSSVLIMAAMREIEVVNRNTQGVRDWEAAIASNTSGIGKDLVEELVAETDEMEG